MIEVKAPNDYSDTKQRVFLAGSIDQNLAENWQQILVDKWKDSSITALNPRREAWDASWKQTKENPNFVQQVHWELDALEHADLIVMYFSPTSQSPISLLELGLFAASQKMVVCCPTGFWRKGNVDIVCDRFAIPQVKSLSELAEYVLKVFLK